MLFVAVIIVALYVNKVFLEIKDSEIADLATAFEQNKSLYLPDPSTLEVGISSGISPGVLVINRDAVGKEWGVDQEVNGRFMKALSHNIAARTPYQVATLVLLECRETTHQLYSCVVGNEASRVPQHIETLAPLDCRETAQGLRSCSFGLRVEANPEPNPGPQVQVARVICNAAVVDRSTQMVIFNEDFLAFGKPDSRHLSQACSDGRPIYAFPHWRIIEWVNSLPTTPRYREPLITEAN